MVAMMAVKRHGIAEFRNRFEVKPGITRLFRLLFDKTEKSGGDAFSPVLRKEIELDDLDGACRQSLRRIESTAPQDLPTMLNDPIARS